jgi:TRAP-type C4-dicarboxylate transport system permease small subunit
MALQKHNTATRFIVWVLSTLTNFFAWVAFEVWIRVREIRYKALAWSLLFWTLATIAIGLAGILLSHEITTTSYKQGQVDVLEGRQVYYPFQHDDGTTTYEMIVTKK